MNSLEVKIAKAEELGASAYVEGKSRVPAQDLDRLSPLLAGNRVEDGQGAKILAGWTKGWDLAQAELKKHRHTPWGYAQSMKVHAPGIVSVGTASHGGFSLDASRWKEFRAVFPTFHPWAGDGWLEEDCDWSLAVLLWPDYFSAHEVYYAVRMVQTHDTVTKDVQQGEDPPYFAEPLRWLQAGSEKAKQVLETARIFEETIKDQWSVSMARAQRDGYQIAFRRGEDCRFVWMEAHPARHWYSDAELDEFTARAKAAGKEPAR